jgi:hypothetical protein
LLKLLDLIIDNDLTEHCRSFFNPIEPQLEIPYRENTYKNIQFEPHNVLENYFKPTQASSNSSADYDLLDYESTDFDCDDVKINLIAIKNSIHSIVKVAFMYSDFSISTQSMNWLVNQIFKNCQYEHRTIDECIIMNDIQLSTIPEQDLFLFHKMFGEKYVQLSQIGKSLS